MASVQPFRVVRPTDALAARVIAPPYDVLTEDQARSIAKERRSFVRVTRAEVDLPEGTDPHSDAAYQQARTTLDAMLEDGSLVLEDTESYVIYGQKMGDHFQVGLIGGASVEEYDDGRIAKHEYTRPDKEDDRTHHMEVLDAQVGLVFLAYRPSPAIDALIAGITASPPRWRVTTEDDVEHTVWSVPADQVGPLQAAFADVDRLYVADGHHRSAAASRVHANRGTALTASFLAGIYPSDQLQVMAYNRVVLDLNGHDADGLLAAIAERWDVSPATSGTPAARGDIHLYLGGSWRTLRLKQAYCDESDPVARLDVARLQDHLLEPLLGIDDPRRSKRITFIGGIHGPDELARQVDAGAALAFSLFPTSLEQLFDVADADRVMPPKSTWFEPKLREGVVLRLLR